MGPEGPIIAMDGPAGAGKSTVAREVARRLGYLYVDTGAMYRVIGLLALERGIDEEDGERLAELVAGVSIAFEPRREAGQRVLADGCDVTDAIRGETVGQWASRVSAHAAVRERLVALQRRIGGRGAAVIEGRDIGTVVFPDADLKFFIEASVEERARRRYLELQAKGGGTSVAEVIAEMEERDRRDSSREHSPLRAAEDADRLDTTGKAVEEVVSHILQKVRALESRHPGE